MKKLNVLDIIALILVEIGGINWGLVGLFKFDLVQWLFGTMPTLAMIVYILIGLSGLYTIYLAMNVTKK
ncbi:MAG: DUF378 domain-containing protein [Patescibacteria group bacterium]|nr:DUF378 domain-containing protein [Patescibacteria group bacterium]